MKETMLNIQKLKKKLAADIESIQNNSAIDPIVKYDLLERTYESGLVEFKKLRSEFIMKRGAEISLLVRKAFRAPTGEDELATAYLMDRYSRLIEKYTSLYSGDYWSALETITLIGDELAMLALTCVLHTKMGRRPEEVPQTIYNATLSDFEVLFPKLFKPVKALLDFEKTWIKDIDSGLSFISRPEPPKKEPTNKIIEGEAQTAEAPDPVVAILKKGGI